MYDSATAVALAPAKNPAQVKTKAKKTRAPAKVSRTRKPEGWSLEEWQIALRREFGRAQRFKIRNLGTEAVFSEYEVTNPETRRTYRVAIRGVRPGENFCACPDFATNTLGTCKHIECALARLEKRPGGKAALRAGFQPVYSELYLAYGARREVRFRPGAECPQALRALANRYFDAAGVLRPEAFGRFDDFLKASKKSGHEVRCYEDALGFIAQVRDQARLKERIAAAFPKGIESAAFKNLLKAPLFPYQREGALFAARAGRALLADEMGLGKTIQAIAAAEILAREGGASRVLVVTPTSLKHQWQQEIARFTDRGAEVIEGSLHARRLKYRSETFYKITNYDVLHRDLEAIQHWAPDLIVLDEAQRIKNWKTRAAQTVKRLSSPYALVLTGTPLENRLEELHSIVEFVDRFRLGPVFRFLDRHQIPDEAGRTVGYRNLDGISETLRPVLLRRTKREVLKQLPERTDKYYFVPMTPQQRQIHDENAELVARIVQKWRRYRFLSEADQLRLRVALQNMRMSCNSTFLVDHATDFGAKKDEICTLLGEWLERPGAKAVVFSQWLRTHELLAARLRKMDVGFVLFHGGVPGPRRKDLVSRFREEQDCRIFLSTDAGGVGLNLQHASAVVNVDQPWNPAVLEQRIGRVHRIGQQRPVQVAHFVAEGTIEHGMLDLLKFKKSLFSGVLDGGETEVFLGGSRLKKFMESVEKATRATPAPAPAEALPAAELDEEETRLETTVAPAAQAPDAPPAGMDASQARALESLVAAGKAFFALLEGALRGPTEPNAGVPRAAGGIERDPRTGEVFLKIPLPAADALQKAAQTLNVLTAQK